MSPKVSIIMPNHNGGNYIKTSIESVINQTYQNWELLIVDDNSNDKSLDIIHKFCELDSRILLVPLHQRGGHPSVVRNEGIKNASGKFIAFLDSDDLWFENKLEHQIRYMKENSIYFSYSGYVCINENGNEKKRTIIPPRQLSYSELLKNCKIGCLTAIYDCEKIGKLYFQPRVGQEDYLYWLAILKKIDYAYGLPDILGAYRLRNNSFSSNKIKMAGYNWNVYYKIEKLGFLRSLFFFSSNIFYWIKTRLS